MKIIKIGVCIILIVSICTLCGCDYQSNEKPEIPIVTGNFDFSILKAGQADAIFLQTENHSIILDCGEKDDGDELVELLQENWF